MSDYSTCVLIPLTRGQFAQVDSEDSEWLNQWKWQCDAKGYAKRTVWDKGKYRTVLMHRLIAGNPKGKLVDHADRDTLNNRRANLRVCTRSQNAMNKKATDGSASRFKGVSVYTRYSGLTAWLVSIKLNGIQTFLGLFENEEEAARAYDEAAKKHFGEFAYLNFP